MLDCIISLYKKIQDLLFSYKNNLFFEILLKLPEILYNPIIGVFNYAIVSISIKKNSK